MTCDRNCNLCTTNDNSRRNCIYDTLRKIDQNQKETIIESDSIGCIGSLITKQYDTKPVVLTLACNEKFTAYIGSSTTTDLFRVEEVNSECCFLRALMNNNGIIQCTAYTCMLKLDCICGLQCLDPINCQISE